MKILGYLIVFYSAVGLSARVSTDQLTKSPSKIVVDDSVKKKQKQTEEIIHSSNCGQKNYENYTDKQINQAKKLLKKNCQKKGDNNSCYALGKFYLIRLHRDLEKAHEFFTTSCNRGHDQSCYRINVLLEKNNLNRAKNNHAVLCDRGDFQSCLRLGGLLKKESPEMAFSYFLKGCDLQSSLSCVSAAKMATDSFQQNNLLNKGCGLGSNHACQLKNNLVMKKGK